MCNNCGNDFPKWSGQCPLCKEWNTFKEIKIPNTPMKNKKGEISESKTLKDIESINERIITKINEFDRVLGGGIVKDSFILLTGDPGVGKSTLALQVASLVSQEKNVMYFSGEESPSQIADRAKRILLGEGKKTNLENLKISSENSLENILTTLEKEKVELVVIDSIQTISSNSIPSISGSSSQVRFCTESLMYYLKKRGLACILIGHVTKGGDFAGPQTLAHLVDCVLYLEGDKYHQFRMLRGQKNRFGSTSEIGIFEMIENGLKEVKNPSEAFLEGRMENAEGSVIIPTIEGTRPFLIELQALTSWSNFGYPKRTASGIDLNRLNLMIAVLQKHGNQKLDSLDVFVNIVGGFKISEPAADLGLILAIASSKLKKNIPNDTIVLGEVGLSGEIRTVSHLEKRLKEAEKLGFKQAIIPNIKENIKTKIELKKVKTIGETLKLIN